VSSSRARVRDGDDVPYPFIVICFVGNTRYFDFWCKGMAKKMQPSCNCQFSPTFATGLHPK
jgi:hypothetical protein